MGKNAIFSYGLCQTHHCFAPDVNEVSVLVIETSGPRKAGGRMIVVKNMFMNACLYSFYFYFFLSFLEKGTLLFSGCYNVNCLVNRHS